MLALSLLKTSHLWLSRDQLLLDFLLCFLSLCIKYVFYSDTFDIRALLISEIVLWAAASAWEEIVKDSPEAWVLCKTTNSEQYPHAHLLLRLQHSSQTTPDPATRQLKTALTPIPLKCFKLANAKLTIILSPFLFLLKLGKGSYPHFLSHPFCLLIDVGSGCRTSTSLICQKAGILSSWGYLRLTIWTSLVTLQFLMTVKDQALHFSRLYKGLSLVFLSCMPAK